ncbi:unnamed protein product [Caenorhabditis brenneri]
MTVACKLETVKQLEASATKQTLVVPRKEVRAVLMVKTADRRRRQHRRTTLRENSNFVLFIFALLMVDVMLIMNTDERHPGPFMKITRFDPTFNFYMMIVLHIMTLFGGLSKTVWGCRLAMGIAWMTCISVFFFALLFPAFTGSYVASGWCLDQNSTRCEEITAEKRFHNGYEVGVMTQILVILMTFASVYQTQLIDLLLQEAHEIEDAIHFAREVAAQGGETGSGVKDAFLPSQ